MRTDERLSNLAAAEFARLSNDDVAKYVAVRHLCEMRNSITNYRMRILIMYVLRSLTSDNHY